MTQWFSADSPWWTQEAADTYPVFDFEIGTSLLREYVDGPARSDGKAPGEPIDVELSCPPDPAESVGNLPKRFDPEAYGWAEQAIQTDDFEERKALYSQIMVRINEQATVWYSGGTATPGSCRAGNQGDGRPRH